MVCVGGHAGRMQDTHTRRWRGEDVMGRKKNAVENIKAELRELEGTISGSDILRLSLRPRLMLYLHNKFSFT